MKWCGILQIRDGISGCSASCGMMGLIWQLWGGVVFKMAMGRIFSEPTWVMFSFEPVAFESFCPFNLRIGKFDPHSQFFIRGTSWSWRFDTNIIPRKIRCRYGDWHRAKVNLAFGPCIAHAQRYSASGPWEIDARAAFQQGSVGAVSTFSDKPWAFTSLSPLPLHDRIDTLW